MPNELWKMHKARIRRTNAGVFVADDRALAGTLSEAIAKQVSIAGQTIYMTSRAMKHLYDKKPAEEFDFVIDHMSMMLQDPEMIYADKSDRRGNFCLTKTIRSDQYLIALEDIYVVTAFRLRNKNYLKSYDLLWSWRDGAHSSPRAGNDFHRSDDAPQ